MIPESRYKFFDIPDGFVIESPERTPTKVIFDGYSMGVCDPADKEVYVSNRLGLFQLGTLIGLVAKRLMSSWNGVEGKFKTKGGHVPRQLKNWAITQCSKALAKKIKERWLQQLTQVNPLVVGVQRRFYSACGKSINILLNPKLYKLDEYYLKDCCNYRAAAMTLNSLELDYGPAHFNSYYAHDVDPPTRYGRVNIQYNNWMEIYCPVGQSPYTSLRKTLMGLPPAIPYYMLSSLCVAEIERPYTNRTELLTLLATIRNGGHHYQRGRTHDIFKRNLKITHRSTKDQIVHSFNNVADSLRYTGNMRNFRKSSRITEIVNYIYDCDDTHNGNIVGMSNKSITWHRQHRYQQAVERLALPQETKTAAPPVPLLDKKEIRFLATVGDVVDEGVSMGHCVGGYAQNAVRGDCYLFHVDFKGESATIEMSPSGRIRQARGPHNGDNAACRWANKYLGEWGKAFPAYNTIKDDRMIYYGRK